MADSLNPDPKYEEEVSGCTASVGVISKNKIYVVCDILPYTINIQYLITIGQLW